MKKTKETSNWRGGGDGKIERKPTGKGLDQYGLP